MLRNRADPTSGGQGVPESLDVAGARAPYARLAALTPQHGGRLSGDGRKRPFTARMVVYYGACPIPVSSKLTDQEKHAAVADLLAQRAAIQHTPPYYGTVFWGGPGTRAT